VLGCCVSVVFRKYKRRPTAEQAFPRSLLVMMRSRAASASGFHLMRLENANYHSFYLTRKMEDSH